MLLICCSEFSFAQTDTLSIGSITYPAPDQKEKIDFRVPAKEKIEQYKNDKRFNYFDQEKKVGVSWSERLWRWLMDKLGKGINNTITSGVVGWIFVIILIIIVIAIIIKLAGINLKVILGKKKIDAPDIDIYTEDVHQMSFDTLIASALKSKDYRLAVRFLYLKNLKLLSEKSIIKWQANKTNYNYQSEIANDILRSKFLDTTLIFDYVWYGEFTLDESKFFHIQNHMDEFYKMVTNER